MPGTAAAHRISPNPTRCAVSAGRRASTAENTSLYITLQPSSPSAARAAAKPGSATPPPMVAASRNGDHDRPRCSAVLTGGHDGLPGTAGTVEFLHESLSGKVIDPVAEDPGLPGAAELRACQTNPDISQPVGELGDA